MEFKEFINKLHSVTSDGTGTAKFTKSVFSVILTPEGQKILDDYTASSYKGFFNGNTSINGISKRINTQIEDTDFIEYIHNFSDATVQNLCNKFREDIPDIDNFNAGEKLSELFVSIIIEAAGAKKKISAPKDTKVESNNSFDAFSNTALELTLENSGSDFIPNSMVSVELDEEKDYEEINPFEKYLEAATSYYSTKKTLLYAEKPHKFYDLYVCNDICYRKFRATGVCDPSTEKTISNVTIDKLEEKSKYIIIQGIGGIGKSMLLTHLFLSSAEQAESSGRTPILLYLKDYKDTTCGIVDFIWRAVKEHDLDITKTDVETALQKKQLIILLDGLDEIQTSNRDFFNRNLETFIKSYPGNTIVVTSRPINAFISYAKFLVFDILKLSKEQAIELVEKLEFWDVDGKHSFLKALDETLYYTHREFASNPLLLTIMLMTYSSFGEVPAKMHVFYSKAYETMSRLHDASKGSFKRPLHTNLSPEEFAKYFSQFCARTYKDEVLEFDSMLFSSYVKKVMKGADPNHQKIASRDFLLDLTENLCIMYREGERYYFIHRSFQEYFAAVYFASEYDANLSKVGNFFEKIRNKSYTDRTFDMLYDMIPEKIERFVFLPYLEKLITECEKKGDDEYWEFLEKMYPYITYGEGETGESFVNEAESFLYRFIVFEKHLEEASDIDSCGWPKQIYDLPTKVWVRAYSEFLEYSAYDKYPNPDDIPVHILESTSIVEEDELPFGYTDYFSRPEQEGLTVKIDINELRKNPDKYIAIRNHMEQPNFPILREYNRVKEYYDILKRQTKSEIESDDLFDD